MRIIMFGQKRIPSREGGVEIVAEKLSVGMVQRGHQLLCYNRGGHHVSGKVFDRKTEKEYCGVVLKQVPTIDRKGLAAVSSSFFAALCSAFSKADVVHIHAEGPAFWSWLPKLFGKKVVVTVHGLDWSREKWKDGFASKYILWGEKMAIRVADAIIVLSQSVQEYFRETYGRETVLIPNGMEKVQPKAAEQIRERFSLEKDSYLLFLGRLVPEKGVHYLIDAFRSLETEKKLVIAGGVSDSDSYAQQLKAKDDSRICFTDFVQGAVLEELYSNCYCYVLPSDLEGMPLSLLEAMSYGCCCLVSDIPECGQVVGENGMLFTHGQVDDLRCCLQKLCDSPDLAEEYRRKIRQACDEKDDWDTVVDKTLEVYASCLKR